MQPNDKSLYFVIKTFSPSSYSLLYFSGYNYIDQVLNIFVIYCLLSCFDATVKYKKQITTNNNLLILHCERLTLNQPYSCGNSFRKPFVFLYCVELPSRPLLLTPSDQLGKNLPIFLRLAGFWRLRTVIFEEPHLIFYQIHPSSQYLSLTNLVTYTSQNNFKPSLGKQCNLSE